MLNIAVSLAITPVQVTRISQVDHSFIDLPNSTFAPLYPAQEPEDLY